MEPTLLLTPALDTVQRPQVSPTRAYQKTRSTSLPESDMVLPLGPSVFGALHRRSHPCRPTCDLRSVSWGCESGSFRCALSSCIQGGFTPRNSIWEFGRRRYSLYSYASAALHTWRNSIRQLTLHLHLLLVQWPRVTSPPYCVGQSLPSSITANPW